MIKAMEYVYYEYKAEDGNWHCGCMEADKALICAIYMGENFHYLDESMIIFEE